MKKILLLGGSRYILPVIKAIHELGYYAITCDYLPDNIAHKYSDEYHNVSIIEKEEVLKLAKELKIDGIMSFACDPGVTTAAYVAENLGLPTCPYASVELLQNKAEFRKFLTDHNFNVPKAKGYLSIEEAKNDLDQFTFPIIVKPVDSAGSKGVTRVDLKDQFEKAANFAVKFSKTNSFIVEEFIQQKGYSSDTDCFSIDGKLVFASFDNQMFDSNAENPYTPSAYSWPSFMPEGIQKELRNELQRLVTLLGLTTSVYNVETRQGIDGKPYIMEFSPRGGGNRLSELLEMSSGSELIKNSVRASVGDPIIGLSNDPVYDGFWAEVVLHSEEEGTFSKLEFKEELTEFIQEIDLWVKEGDSIHKFTGANEAIGTLVLRFNTKDQLEKYMENIDSYIFVRYK